MAALLPLAPIALPPAIVLAQDPSTLPATQPTTRPADILQAMRQLEMDQTVRQTASLPSLGEKDINDLLRFSIRDGQLILDVPMAPTDPANVRILGRPFTAQVSLIPRPRFRMMSFLAHDFSSPGAVVVQTQIMSGPIQLLIAQDIEFPAETRSTTLMEQLVKHRPVSVTMRVQDIINSSGKDIAHIKLSAPTFEELRKEYPSETDKYLRPIFREIGEEADVFLIDRARAWQVLSDEGTGDNRLPDEVKQIVARFDADDYSTRQSAMADLEKLGESAALVLQHADRAKWSEQQRAMVDTFLVHYRPLSDADVKRYRADPEFLLDCLYNPEPEIRQMATQRLEALTGGAFKIDPAHDPADRRRQIEAWRMKLTAGPTSEPSPDDAGK
jgi:hypothetical protein